MIAAIIALSVVVGAVIGVVVTCLCVTARMEDRKLEEMERRKNE